MAGGIDMTREPELPGQTVVVIGGSAGIGLETARRARAEGADVILTGRNPERLAAGRGASSARTSTAAFDASDPEALERFFADLPDPIDHVMVTAGGPYYAPLADMDFDGGAPLARRARPAGAPRRQLAAAEVRPGGTLLFIGGTGGRNARASASRSSAPAPRRCPPSSRTWRSRSRRSGSTSSPPASSTRRCRRRCSATSSTRAASSCARRCRSGASSARPTSPRSPSHLMTNTALTGATYDIDGGQQLV